jgi:hypothetical protein
MGNGDPLPACKKRLVRRPVVATGTFHHGMNVGRGHAFRLIPLVGEHGLDHWAQGFFVPASATSADPAEPGFILEEQAYRTFFREAQGDFCPRGRKFFSSLRAPRHSLWDAGCRGASLRQP